MSILLNKLYKSVISQYPIKLVAGEKGLSNEVNWIHMVENKEISTFLDGKELVFTTGIGASTPESLFSLIKDNVKNGASGMVVNIGPYIKEITNEMIDYCNEMDFPLFVVPWQVKMARIIKVFCSYILEAEKNNVELASAFRNAIYSPEQEKLYVPVIEEHGIRNNGKYYMAIVGIEGIPVSEMKLKDIKQKTDFMIDQLYGKAIVSEFEDSLVILFSDLKREEIVEFFNRLVKVLKEKYSEIFFQIAIGDEVVRLNNLSKSYSQAYRLQRVNKGEVIGNTIKSYGDIGALKILLELDYDDVVKDFIVETIEALDEYDKLKGTDYVKVLGLYLQHNGKVNVVAEELFVHRNTINYKVKRIESILDCDLSDFMTRLNLAIALMLKRIF